MNRLLLTYFIVFSLFHIHVAWKFHAAFPAARVLIAVLLLAGLCILPAQLAVDGAIGGGRLVLARNMALAVYLWIGVVFWFCVLAAGLDLLRLAGRLTGLACLGWLSPRQTLACTLVLLGAGLGWSLFEASQVRLRSVEVELDGLPAGSAAVRVALISDLHQGLPLSRSRLRRIVSLVEAARPDLVLSAGDLIDAPAGALRPEAALLAGVRAPLGKLGITGNHEHRVGLAEALAFHRAAGFELLRGFSVEVTPGLRVAGADESVDPATGNPAWGDERRALAWPPLAPLEADLAVSSATLNAAPRKRGGPPRRNGTAAGDPAPAPRPAFLLLKHAPLPAGALRAGDLQLSGHTHGGQIFPFQYLLAPFYPYQAGMHTLASGGRLFVTRGAGTWGPPLRFLAVPEVVVFTLRPRGPGRRGG